MAEEKEKKKLWPILLPPILTTTAALTAASTTIFVNMRNDQRAQAQAAADAQRQPREREEARQESSSPDERPVRLRLDRIVVTRDGALGAADWRFVIEANGQPLFVFTQDNISDRAGRNVITPEPAPSAALWLSPERPTTLSIKGWRSAWYRRGEEPQVIGGAALTAASTTPIEVDVQAETSGRFSFQFSLVAAQE